MYLFLRHFLSPGLPELATTSCSSGSVLFSRLGSPVYLSVKMRSVVVEQSGRTAKPGLRLPRLKRLFPSWAGPSLDGNPVLWREWHRNQPSRLARVLWVTVLSLTWILAAWGSYELIHEGPGTARAGGWAWERGCSSSLAC